MAHLHSVYDTDPHFKIDAITREIINQSEKKTKLMQYDHNSERFTFELPRFVDGHDMTLSNQIRVHYINAGSARQQSKDVYPVYDMQPSPSDSNVVIFSWLISQGATRYAGTLNFLVEFSCVDAEGIVEYTWHTEIFKGITVSTGMSNTENLAIQVSDVVAQWEQELFGVGDSVIASVEDTKNKAISEVEAKGAETLKTIPDDYTTVYELANDAVRTRANAIVENADGEVITITDSSGDYLRGLRIFGKSTQAEEPSPDNPQEIVSIENPTVDIYGVNLLKENTGYKHTHNGLTCEYEGDGVYHIYGIYSGTNPSTQFADMRLDLPVDPNAHYTICAQLIEGVPADDFHPYVGVASNTVSHRNWMAVSIENTTKLGETKSTTSIPANVIENPTTINKFWIYAHNDTLEEYTTDFRLRVWLTKSEAPVAYVPYNKQSLATTYSLSGIPVSSGGNYTDANGQQWICDEVDLARGVFIQRIMKYTLDNSYAMTLVSTSNEKTRFDIDRIVGVPGGAVMCDSLVHSVSQSVNTIQMHGDTGKAIVFVDLATTVEDFKAYLATHPMELFVQIEPAEIALTDTEIFKFSQLHSNYPNTTILNDAGAWMEVAYNADTELYFNNSRGATDEQVDKSVDAWLTAHFTNAEEVSF